MKRNSRKYGYGKIFNTRQLIGEHITVATRDSRLEIHGILKEFFERTEAIAVQDYRMTLRQDDGSREELEKGDMIFMKRDSWLSMRVKRLINKKLIK